MRIIDVTNPQSPVLVGSFGANAIDVHVNGNRAYVLSGDPLQTDRSNTLIIYDISNPTLPVQLGSVSVFRAREVVVSGNYAYTAGDNDEKGVRCVNVSDPAHPVVVDSAYVASFTAQPLISGNLLNFFKREGPPTYEMGIVICDVGTPPGRLIKRGEMRSPWINFYCIQNPFLYAAFSAEEPFWKVDVSNPSNPTVVNKYDFPSAPQCYFFQGNYLYIGDMFRLYRYNVENPEAPVYLDFIKWAGITTLRVKDNIMYALSRWDGRFYVFDISDFSHSRRLAEYFPSGGSKDFDLRGNYVYLVTEDGKFQVINVANPSNPTRVGELRLPAIARDLYLPESGSVVYVAYGDGYTPPAVFKSSMYPIRPLPLS